MKSPSASKRRARPSWIGSFVAVSLLASLAACERKDDRSRAAHGDIDWHAPVRTTAAITIKAPRAVIWKTLSDVARWPLWQPDIQTTTIAAPPAVGVPFIWATSGGTIHSRIVLCEPEHRLAWVGHLSIFHAIHVWELASTADGETRVTTTESLSGWPIGWFYSSDELHEADQRWLVALKRKTEQMIERAGARAG